MSGNKKYFWLKLKRDFFKRHDIQIIEAMQNGKDYILFYLKLLCESVDHEGKLRFSEQIPYNEQMLATITNTNVDIVRAAIKVFTELEMMEILDDGTLFMLETQKMIGSAEQDEHTRENTRLRVQAYRERKKQAQIEEKRYSNVTCNVEIEKDIDIELEKEKEKKKVKHAHGENKNVKLTDEEYQRLIKDYGEEATKKAIQFFDDYLTEKPYKSKSHNMAMRRWVFDAVREREQKQAGKKPNNSFNNFKQNTYTPEQMNDLERQLCDNY